MKNSRFFAAFSKLLKPMLSALVLIVATINSASAAEVYTISYSCTASTDSTVSGEPPASQNIHYNDSVTLNTAGNTCAKTGHYIADWDCKYQYSGNPVEDIYTENHNASCAPRYEPKVVHVTVDDTVYKYYGTDKINCGKSGSDHVPDNSRLAPTEFWVRYNDGVYTDADCTQPLANNSLTQLPSTKIGFYFLGLVTEKNTDKTLDIRPLTDKGRLNYGYNGSGPGLQKALFQDPSTENYADITLYASWHRWQYRVEYYCDEEFKEYRSIFFEYPTNDSWERYNSDSLCAAKSGYKSTVFSCRDISDSDAEPFLDLDTEWPTNMCFKGNVKCYSTTSPNNIVLNWYNSEVGATPDVSTSCTYDKTVDEVGTLTIPDNPPTKTGYTFKGWNILKHKNLFNPDTVTNKYRLTQYGANHRLMYADCWYSALIPVVPGQEYVLSANIDAFNSNSYIYGILVSGYTDGAWQSLLVEDNTYTYWYYHKNGEPYERHFNVPSTVDAVRIHSCDTLSNVQLELGSTKTDYVSYDTLIATDSIDIEPKTSSHLAENCKGNPINNSIEESVNYRAVWEANVYDITLNHSDLEDHVYEKYGTGWYHDSETHTPVNSENPENIPTVDGMKFRGYYTTSQDAINAGVSCTPQQISEGTCSVSAPVIERSVAYADDGHSAETSRTLVLPSNTTFTADTTLYAAWAFDCEDTTPASHAHCALYIGTNGYVQYETFCDDGYALVSGTENTYNPQCVEDETYNVMFEKNAEDAVGSKESVTCSVNTDCVVTNNNEITRPDNDFIGWSTSPTGTTVEYTTNINKSTTDDVTLYAVWQPTCVHVLHVGTGSLCLYKDKISPAGNPSLAISLDGHNTYYAAMSLSDLSMSETSTQKLHVKYGENIYNVHDLTVIE